MHPSVYVVAAAVVSSVAASVQADPLAPLTLPGDTRWVLHADVDAAHAAAPLWDLARRRVYEPRRADLAQRLTILERLTGMRPAEDLKDITLYGNAYDESSVCIRIHGTVDKESLIPFLKSDGEYREIPHGDRTLIAWRDKGRDRLMYVCFAQGDLAYLSTSIKVIEAALDTMDQKAPSLPADSPLVPEVGAAAPGRAIVWIAGRDLMELPRAQKTESPMLAQMDAASLGVRWANEKATLDLHVTARNDKAAQQMQAVAEGMKALVQLAAADEHAPPRTKLLGAAFAQLAVSTDGPHMKGEWGIGLDKIEALMDLAGGDLLVPTARPVPQAPRVP